MNMRFQKKKKAKSARLLNGIERFAELLNTKRNHAIIIYQAEAFGTFTYIPPLE